MERPIPAPGPDEVVLRMRASGATITHALGVMPEMLFRSPEPEHDRDNKMRIALAIPVAEEWAKALEERSGIRIM